MLQSPATKPSGQRAVDIAVLLTSVRGQSTVAVQNLMLQRSATAASDMPHN